jgi:hypothetical protein
MTKEGKRTHNSINNTKGWGRSGTTSTRASFSRRVRDDFHTVDVTPTGGWRHSVKPLGGRRSNVGSGKGSSSLVSHLRGQRLGN